MKKTAIYARYSSYGQTEQSIEGQMTVCNKFAEDNGLEIVKVYADRAMTGKNDLRPEFQKMLKESEKADYEVLLVYSLDRFGRNAIEIAINSQKLKKNGIILISATQRTSENIDGTKNLDGIILENVYIGIAEYYSEELSQKVRRGQNESRKKGQFCGGSIAYGYKVVNKRVQIDEEPAKVVNMIFNDYALGMEKREIIDELNKLGILYKGKPFSMTFISSILNNTRYSGVVEHEGVYYDNIYPKLIEPKTIEQVHKRLAERSGKFGYGKEAYILSNKLYCGYCGCNISGESGKGRDGVVKRYYKCNGKKKHHNGCTKQQIRKEDLETAIVESLIKILRRKTVMEPLIDHIMEEQNSYIKNDERLMNLSNSKLSVDAAIKNIMNMIENGVSSVTVAKRLAELEKESIKLQQEIDVEEANQPIKLTREEVEAYFARVMRRSPKIIISNVVDKIILYDEYAEVILKNPIKQPDENPDYVLFKTKTSFDELKRGNGDKKQVGFTVKYMT